MAYEHGFAAGVSASAQPAAIGAAPLAVETFDQLKGQFLASLNHELRTPLSGVIGMADLLRETSLDPEQREYVDTVRECAQQLLETLNAVLDYSALSSGSVKMTESEFSLAALAGGVVDEVKKRSEAKDLDIRLEIAPGVPDLLEGDAVHLRQVLQHLLRNAVKFTPCGEVAVKAEAPEWVNGWVTVEITVSDTGIGIPPAKMRTIFEAFRQLDNGLSRSYTGLGLGLALTNRITQMMGGTVAVESEPGFGSCFRIRVPLRTAEQNPQTAACVLPDAHLINVLVVEDNKIARRLVGRMLERAGCRVTFAGSGREGIEKALSNAFDVILMDMQMPGMDGLAATRAIRQSARGRQVPIVALTANTTDGDREACFEAGMQGFLAKPVHREELLATISALVPQTTAE